MTDTAAPRPDIGRRAMLVGPATVSVAGVFAKPGPAMAQVAAVPEPREEPSDATPYGVGSPF